MKYEKKLKEYFNKYVNKLGLNNKKINYHITSYTNDDDYYGIVNSRMYDAGYYDVIFNGNRLHDDLEDTVAHELSHIFLFGITDLYESLLEVVDLSISQKERLENELRKREHEIIERLIKILL